MNPYIELSIPLEVREELIQERIKTRIMPFRRPNFELLDPLPASRNDNIRTYPELLAFNAKHNGPELFCLQGLRDSTEPAVPITFAAMQKAVERCKAWLVANVTGIELPKVGTDGKVVKCPAVGILMGSDVGIVIYMTALLALGVPVSSIHNVLCSGLNISFLTLLVCRLSYCPHV